ncbi:MAG: hypothetical protein ACRDS0_03750 [Pseudonocardiaceae bacterium]
MSTSTTRGHATALQAPATDTEFLTTCLELSQALHQLAGQISEWVAAVIACGPSGALATALQSITTGITAAAADAERAAAAFEEEFADARQAARRGLTFTGEQITMTNDQPGTNEPRPNIAPYDAEVAALRKALTAAPCPACQDGADQHTVMADADGHAHAWCDRIDGEFPNPFTAPHEGPGTAAPAEQAAAPIEYRMSDEPLLQNTWGGFAEDPIINYHQDGAIGLAIERMGRDVHLDVDGDALANVLGRLATDAVVGRTTSQDALDRLKRLRDRLPESKAKHQLAYAVNKLDAPNTPPPQVPAGTPPALRQLLTDLHAVPLVRRDPSKEQEPLLSIITDVTQGKTGGLRLTREVRRLQNRRHESVEGKSEIDRAITRATKTLEDDHRNRRRPPD